MDQEHLDRMQAQQAERLAQRTIDPKLDIVLPAPTPAPKANVKEQLEPSKLRALAKVLIQLLEEGAQSIEISTTSAQQCIACLLTIAEIAEETKRMKDARKAAEVAKVMQENMR